MFLENLYEYGSLPDMHTPKAAQRLMVYISSKPPPLVSWKQLKPGSMQVCKPIVFIGKVVGIDCGFSLTGNFHCITFKHIRDQVWQNQSYCLIDL